MPDQRKHRGPHPQDHDLFGLEALPALRQATADLSWLLTGGYARTSSLKLVGDRYELTARQRLAVARCACADSDVESRRARRTPPSGITSSELWIDGYNVLTSLEAALAGGVILGARDGCFRDMASMHGSYRKVAETLPAIQMLGESLHGWGLGTCRWLLDQPVSNSGRLKTLLRETAAAHRWDWSVELVPDPDTVLINSRKLVASADSQVVDKCDRWFNLARLVIAERVPEAWIADLSIG